MTGYLGSLCKTITLLVPIAYLLLALRVIARTAPDGLGTKVLSEIELVALRSKVGERLLPKKPTSRHVLLAVARLGGHLRSNGEPGWLVLGRGLERLETIAWASKEALKFLAEGGLSEK